MKKCHGKLLQQNLAPGSFLQKHVEKLRTQRNRVQWLTSMVGRLVRQGLTNRSNHTSPPTGVGETVKTQGPFRLLNATTQPSSPVSDRLRTAFRWTLHYVCGRVKQSLTNLLCRLRKTSPLTWARFPRSSTNCHSPLAPHSDTAGHHDNWSATRLDAALKPGWSSFALTRGAGRPPNTNRTLGSPILAGAKIRCSAPPNNNRRLIHGHSS